MSDAKRTTTPMPEPCAPIEESSRLKVVESGINDLRDSLANLSNRSEVLSVRICGSEPKKNPCDVMTETPDFLGFAEARIDEMKNYIDEIRNNINHLENQCM